MAYSVLKLSLILLLFVLILFSISPLLLNYGVGTQKLLAYSYSHICHQMDERCIQIEGSKSLVCFRCLGIYFGFLIAMLFISPRLKEFPKAFVFLLVSQFFLEIILEKLGFVIFNNTIRFISGYLFAIPFSSYLNYSLVELSISLTKRNKYV